MENTLYIIDPANFNGQILNTMPHVHKNGKNGKALLNMTYLHYTKQTFAEYNAQHGGNLQAYTWDEFYPMLEEYNKKTYCKPWKEVTEEEYWDALECLPPCNWHDINNRFNVFFISEALTADLHSFFIKDKKTGKYYAATRSRFSTDAELLEELNKL